MARYSSSGHVELIIPSAADSGFYFGKIEKKGKGPGVDTGKLFEIDEILKTWLSIDWKGDQAIEQKLQGWYRLLGRDVGLLRGILWR